MNMPKIFLLPFFIIVAVILYANSLSGSFILDDEVLLVRNQHVKSLSNIPRIFKTGVFHSYTANNPSPSQYYRPFQPLSYALEYVFWKQNPFGYHLTNIFIHSINSFLVFLLLYALFKDPLFSFIAAVLFCISPMQVCLAAFISGRAHLLGAAFMLGSLIASISYAAENKQSAYALSLLLCICGLFSWEGVLLLPLLMAACALVSGLNKRRILFNASCCLVIMFIYMVLRAKYFPSDKFFIGNLFSPMKIYHSLGYVYSYLEQFILPIGLGVQLFGKNTFLKPALFAVSLIIALYALYAILFRKDRIAILAALFYFIGLLPVINLLDTLAYFGPVLSEHYAYMAGIGFFMLSARLLADLSSFFKKPLAFILVPVCIASSSLTVLNNANYKNDFVFYDHILTVDPGHTFIRINLGSYYCQQGLYDMAIDQAHKVLAEEKDAWDAYQLLGNVSFKKGQLQEAEASFKKAAALNPQSAESYYNLGIIYKEQGENDKAIEQFRKAVMINGEFIAAMQDLSDIFMSQNRHSESLQLSKSILRVDPANISAQVKLGVILAASGDIKEAESVFKEALKSHPDSVDAMRNLGVLYGNLGEFDKAISLWKRALVLDPNNQKLKEDIDYAKQLIEKTRQ